MSKPVLQVANSANTFNQQSNTNPTLSSNHGTVVFLLPTSNQDDPKHSTHAHDLDFTLAQRCLEVQQENKHLPLPTTPLPPQNSTHAACAEVMVSAAGKITMHGQNRQHARLQAAGLHIRPMFHVQNIAPLHPPLPKARPTRTVHAHWRLIVFTPASAPAHPC